MADRTEAEIEAFAAKLTKLMDEKQGLYFHPFDTYMNGEQSFNAKTKVASIQMKVPIDELGSNVDDMRALMRPHSIHNKLVPMIVFIDPEMFMKD